MDNLWPLIGTILTLGAGIYSILQPRRLAEFLHMGLLDGRGVAEFRIGFGGVFVGLALLALVHEDPLVFTALGGAWLGAALVRLGVILVDRPPLDGVYVGLFVFELLVGLLFFL